MLRRALFVHTSLTVALCHSHYRTATRTTSETKLPSKTTTLWCDCAAADVQVPRATVEDMFGRMEGDHDNDDEDDASVPQRGKASLTSSRHIIEEAFFEWVGDYSSSTAEGMGDFSLESVMNATLVEPHPQGECSAADRALVSGDIYDSDDDGLDVNCDDAGGEEEGLVSHNNDILICEVDDDGLAVAGGSGALLDAEGGHHEGENHEDDVEDDDASTIAAAEEEEQVEQLLCATRTAESTAALFFKGKEWAAKIRAAKPSFDDAAAEGAELETVGEVMPSPQRF
ncbi:hypothetical protein TraAM80_04847 [Trypanosoma rangeli]|uniref:Uncharacterized protein n=1 Tax=Trypanosoma rangeli TaxID=5698 RepID=A0A3R7LX93_TRYRA|nr:uncharacterized protein TraAM80_04847 [Trypanosoma rangeli]RNF05118.1 hypothetical protein TraAM80_04847 [Trypanosoma rangeli]|eukprot:RNF05118.1 hypothetical protein TraAM80_04847 [Trypanosoma rangeli]